MKRLILGMILLYTCISFASIYMEQEKDGDVVYSDTPSSNSKQITAPNPVNSAPSFQSTPILTKPAMTDSATQPDEDYSLFQIISPKNQESIQNQAGFTVQIKIEPELKKDDKIQLYVDGKAWGSPQNSTSLNISTLARGTHDIYAVLLDKNQRIIRKSNAVTIYNHRVNTNFRPGV